MYSYLVFNETIEKSYWVVDSYNTTETQYTTGRRCLLTVIQEFYPDNLDNFLGH